MSDKLQFVDVCVFRGGIGLAEYWIDHKLDPKGKRWVSACILIGTILKQIVLRQRPRDRVSE